MSTILHRKHVDVDIAISGYESGRELADAACDVQVEFLRGMADALLGWNGTQSWPMQCRMIADELGNHPRRAELARMIHTLHEHLAEPAR